MKNKIDRKNKIINDSFKDMYLKGFNGCSVNDLAKAAKIPKGSFYNYFEGKEQYAIDAINYYGQINQNDFSILIDNSKQPLDRIKSFYLTKIEKAKHLGVAYGCFVGNLSGEVGGVYPDIALAASNFHQDVEAKIYVNLVEAKNNNQLLNKSSEEILASVIVSMWQGALLRTKVSSDQKYLLDFYEVLKNELLA